MRLVSSLLLAFAVGLLATTASNACSIVLPVDYNGSVEQAKNVRSRIAKATMIVDGEVIRPWASGTPALVRVHRILKGGAASELLVGSAGAGADCSIALEKRGERFRMILSGGPKVYDLFYDQSEARLEDRILKSDRRKVWPYYSGQDTAAK